ncbi:TonB-dependent receptor [Bacteroidia bacterium]|nr:TonB-dependent receptor [Bacteroidia bacterium]
MKNIILMLALLTYSGAFAQQDHHIISGKVTTTSGDPLPGAFVHWQDKNTGVFADSVGNFTIEHQHESPFLVVSFASYLSDTTEVKDMSQPLSIALREGGELKTANVFGKRISYGLSKLSPRTTVLMGEREFQKAACCNLSESFENSPAIDVSFSDAVTGTKQIKMLGLDGFYTLIGREYMPSVRTLNSYYGLSHIPAAWVDGIQITKGAGSVVNGYESIAGQINIELKKPFGKEKFLLDQFVGGGGRLETDLMYVKDINKHLATSLMARYGYQGIQNDRNDDGFLDMPLSKDFKVMNRWQFYADNGLEGTANVSYHKNEQDAGQKVFYDDNLGGYGINIDSKVIDAFAKLGKTIKGKEFGSFGSQYNYNHSEMTSTYGSATNNKVYRAHTDQAYLNLLYESIIGNSFHQFQTGISMLYDKTNETYDGFHFERTETVPGAFFEYTYKPKETFSLVGGLRTDYNSIYGLSITPRFHGKYRFNKDKTSLRMSAGMGRRTSNPLAQNQFLFASGRSLNFIFTDAALPYGLEQEEAINSGLSFEHELRLGYMPATIGLDYFNTTFLQEVVVDRETEALASFYNMKNGTRANSFQAQLDLQPARRTEVRIAYRMFDVQSKYYIDGGPNSAAAVNTKTLAKPFISKHRAFINVTQRTRNDWQFSSTATWYGPQRIAGSTDTVYSNGVSLAYTVQDNYSPNFLLLNAQVSKTFKKQFEVYLGAENILNYRQDNPIQEAANPFDQKFDAGLVWGPIFGRMFYGGFRWRFKSE